MASSPVSPLEDIAREVAALPDGAAWIRGALLKRLVTALIRDRARGGANVDEIPSDKGRFLNAQAGGSSPAKLLPWQPYPSPYTGAGSAPAGQGLKIRIVPAYVWDGSALWIPARTNIEITVPANCTDGYHVWLVGSVSAAATLSALDYGHGTMLPGAVTVAASASGTPPPTVYDLLFTVTSTATAVELPAARTYRNVPLALVPEVAQVNAQGAATERRMVFLPRRDPDDIPAA